MRGTLRRLTALGRDPALVRRLTAARLNHETGFGFTEVPPPSPPRRLRADALVLGSPEMPIAWRRAGGEIVCSVNGHAFTLPDDPRVPRLLRRLNTGRPERVGELMKAGAGTVRRGGAAFSATPGDVRALLERLLALRGITEASGAPGRVPL